LTIAVASILCILLAGCAASQAGQSGNVLYQADWSKGMDGWSGSADWKHFADMLVNDGSNIETGHRIMAPYQPKSQDYAIEAKILLIDPQCGGTKKQFGLIARATEQGGILGGFDCPQAALASTEDGRFDFFDPIASQDFTPGTKWHIYRLAVQGNKIRLFVDGAPLLEKANKRYLDNGKVGMFSIGAQISVRSFKVLRL